MAPKKTVAALPEPRYGALEDDLAPPDLEEDDLALLYAGDPLLVRIGAADSKVARDLSPGVGVMSISYNAARTSGMRALYQRDDIRFLVTEAVANYSTKWTAMLGLDDVGFNRHLDFVYFVHWPKLRIDREATDFYAHGTDWANGAFAAAYVLGGEFPNIMVSLQSFLDDPFTPLEDATKEDMIQFYANPGLCPVELIEEILPQAPRGPAYATQRLLNAVGEKRLPQNLFLVLGGRDEAAKGEKPALGHWEGRDPPGDEDTAELRELGTETVLRRMKRKGMDEDAAHVKRFISFWAGWTNNPHNADAPLPARIVFVKRQLRKSLNLPDRAW